MAHPTIDRLLARMGRVDAAISRAVESPRTRTWARVVLPAVPVLYALVQGVYQVYLDRGLVLDPDVLYFRSLAEAMTPATLFGGVREPIWPVLYLLPVRLLGSHSDIAIRLLGVAGFAFMVFAVQLLARRAFGPSIAILAALAVAASPWLIFEAGRGLREETAAALVALLCVGLVQPGLSTRRFVMLFGLAGVTGLLRWDAMEVMLGLLVVALIVYRPHPAAWIVGPLVAMLIVSPLLVANYIREGDALYHSNYHARFFRNLEFHDQPGFLTSAQLAGNSFAGPPITWTQYVFGLHSPGELGVRAVRAFVLVPIRVTNFALNYPPHSHAHSVVDLVLRDPEAVAVGVIYVLSVVGGISLLFTRAWPVPVYLGGTILLYSPIASLIDYRLVITVVPALLLCAIEGIRFSERYWGPGLRRLAARYAATSPVSNRDGARPGNIVAVQ